MGRQIADGPLGLIGLGLVGKALAGRFLEAGLVVLGYDISVEARCAAGAMGLEVAEEAREVAEGVQTLLLSLPDSEIVGEVLWGEGGVADSLEPGDIVLDTTTGRASDAERNHSLLAERGVDFVDVTLSGSSGVIARGEATALVGATQEAAGDYSGIISHFAREIIFLGRPGGGCLAKLITNLVMGVNRAALAEGLALAQRSGVDGAQILGVLRNSAAYSRVMDIKGERMISRDFEPESRITQHAKDVGLILELAREVGARTPLEEAHAGMLEEALQAGWGELDNAAIIKAYLEDG